MHTQTLTSPKPAAIEQYLRSTIAAIDSAFGDGYAKKNPDLLAALIRAQVALQEVGK